MHLHLPPFPAPGHVGQQWPGLDLGVFTDGHRTGDHGAHLGALVTEALAAAVVPGGARRVHLAVWRTQGCQSVMKDVYSSVLELYQPRDMQLRLKRILCAFTRITWVYFLDEKRKSVTVLSLNNFQ